MLNCELAHCKGGDLMSAVIEAKSLFLVLVNRRLGALIDYLDALEENILSIGPDDFKRHLSLIFFERSDWSMKIAKAMGCHVTTVRRWYGGKTCPPKKKWAKIIQLLRKEASAELTELNRIPR